MAVQASVVITNARVLLNDVDEGGIRWTDAELIAWLNEAMSEVVRIAPQANSKTTDLALVAGTRQQIPLDGVQLINVLRNAPNGRVIRIVDHDILDNEHPDWHQKTPVATVMRYTFDPQNPRVFHVFPPNNAAGQATVVYSAVPTPIALKTDNIPLPDIYAGPLTNYICYRAWLKQLGDKESFQRAGSYKQLFDGQMGVKKQAETESDPNMKGAVLQ